MRLILNKALDNINDNVNLKIIEITSTDFLNNDLDYFVYKYQIPLIKFTDTEEIFNIKNFKIELSSSLSEAELILTESDLELLSGGGSGGGTQDLQSVLDNGNISSESINLENSTQFTRLSPGSISLSIDDMGIASEGELGATQLKFTSDLGYTNTLHPNTASISSFYFPEKTGDYTLATLDDISLQTAINGGNTTDSDIWMLPTGGYTLKRSSTQALPVGVFKTESVPTLPSSLQSVLALGIASNVPEDIIVPTIFSKLKPNVNTTGNSIFYLPIGSGGEATLATLDDIYKIPNLPIYANNTSAISGGLVVDSIYKTVTGELRIVV